MLLIGKYKKQKKPYLKGLKLLYMFIYLAANQG